MPRLTIISPNCLYFANTMIFLTSFMVSVDIGVITVVTVPNHSIYFKIGLLLEISV